MRLRREFFLLFPLLPLLLVLFSADQAFLVRDVSLVYLPAKKFWVDAVLAGQGVPGWNPLAYGGTPFRADMNAGPLHPLNFLFLIFPNAIDRGYLLFLLAHSLLLMLGSYLLFCRFHFGRDGAFLATLTLALGGAAASTWSIVNVAAAWTALPFFLYFLWCVRTRFSLPQFVGLVLAWAWPIYAGDPQFSYWMGLVAIVVMGERSRSQRSLFPLAILCAGALTTLALASAQWLPAIQLAQGAERGLGSLSLVAAERFSFHPARLLEFLFPLPFGNPGNDTAHWLGRFSDEIFTMPFLLHLYSGLVIFYLFLWRFFRLFRKPQSQALWLLGALAFLLLLSFGKNSVLPLNSLFFSYVPAWNLFRYPERLMLLLVFLLFLWCGPGFRWLAKAIVRPSARSFELPGRLTGLVIILGTLAFFLHRRAEALEARTLLLALTHFCLITALFTLFWRHRLGAVRRFAFPLFCTLLVLDLLPFSFLLAWRSSAEEIPFRKNVFAEKVTAHLVTRAEEVGKGAASRYFHGTYRGLFPTSATQPLAVGQAWDWGVMYPNIANYFGLASPVGYGSFDPKEILGFWEKHRNQDPERLTELFSVAYFPVKGPEGKPVVQFNPRALPQVWLPLSVQNAMNYHDAERILFAKEFPYRERAVVEGFSGAEGKGEIAKVTRTPDHLTVELKNLTGQATVVWNERWNANWRVSFNGEALAVHRANAWAMSAQLPAGVAAGTLEFRYEDFFARLGNWISVLTALALLSALVGTRLQLYRRKPESIHR